MAPIMVRARRPGRVVTVLLACLPTLLAAQAPGASGTTALRGAYDARPGFDTAVAVAEALAADGSNVADARVWADRAYSHARPGAERAKALFAMARTYDAGREQAEYKAFLRRAVGEYPLPEAQDALLRSARSTPMSAGEITRSFRVAKDTKSRDLVMGPSVDLAIGFAVNSAEVDVPGRAQIRELSTALRDALSGQGEGGRGVIVIGHTDTTGSEAYNLQLSKRRAASVRDLLVTEFGFSPAQIHAEGRGMREPLIPGNTPEHHALNRRVEVRLQP